MDLGLLLLCPVRAFAPTGNNVAPTGVSPGMDTAAAAAQQYDQHRQAELFHVRHCDVRERSDGNCATCQFFCNRNECRICFETLGALRSTVRCDQGCGAIFHKACIQRWIETPPEGGGAPIGSCPLCRARWGESDSDEPATYPSDDDASISSGSDASVASEIHASMMTGPSSDEHTDEASSDGEQSADEVMSQSSDEEGRDEQAEAAAEAEAKARAQQGISWWQEEGPSRFRGLAAQEKEEDELSSPPPMFRSLATVASTPVKEREIAWESPPAGGKRPASSCGPDPEEETAIGKLLFQQRKAMRSMRPRQC